MTRAIQNTIFIYFGQVFQKLWQNKCNLTTFWHGLLPNMAMPRDSGRKFVISIFKILFSINVRKSHQSSWFCCIPDGSYKEDNLKVGRICPPPPCGIGLRLLDENEENRISNSVVLFQMKDLMG